MITQRFFSNPADIKVRLTDNQQSALEVSGWDVEEPDGSWTYPVLYSLWDGGPTLRVPRDKLSDLAGEFTDMANAEDYFCEEKKDKEACKARRALTALASKLRRA